jgi:hypothetical protein
MNVDGLRRDATKDPWGRFDPGARASLTFTFGNTDIVRETPRKMLKSANSRSLRL